MDPAIGSKNSSMSNPFGSIPDFNQTVTSGKISMGFGVIEEEEEKDEDELFDGVLEKSQHPTDDEKNEKRKKAGQSLMSSLIESQQLRQSSMKPEPVPSSKDVPPSLRETMMPDFNISNCDHLGLASNSYTRLMTQKNLEKISYALK